MALAIFQTSIRLQLLEIIRKGVVLNLPKKTENRKATDTIFKGGQQPAKNAYANNAMKNSENMRKLSIYFNYIIVYLLSCVNFAQDMHSVLRMHENNWTRLPGKCDKEKTQREPQTSARDGWTLETPARTVSELPKPKRDMHGIRFPIGSKCLQTLWGVRLVCRFGTARLGAWKRTAAGTARQGVFLFNYRKVLPFAVCVDWKQDWSRGNPRCHDADEVATLTLLPSAAFVLKRKPGEGEGEGLWQLCAHSQRTHI